MKPMEHSITHETNVLRECYIVLKCVNNRQTFRKPTQVFINDLYVSGKTCGGFYFCDR